MTWIEHGICVCLITAHINRKLSLLKEKKTLHLASLKAEPEMGILMQEIIEGVDLRDLLEGEKIRICF